MVNSLYENRQILLLYLTIFFWAGSSDGRSSPWHGGGPGFKSRSVHF